MLSGNAKWGGFYGCKGFILPSHQENFVISVVEALACGRPVLISDKINIWHEIVESGAGLVENDTPEGTKKLLESFIQLSVNEIKTMSEKARNCFMNNFSISNTAKRFCHLLVE